MYIDCIRLHLFPTNSIRHFDPHWIEISKANWKENIINIIYCCVYVVVMRSNIFLTIPHASYIAGLITFVWPCLLAFYAHRYRLASATPTVGVKSPRHCPWQ